MSRYIVIAATLDRWEIKEHAEAEQGLEVVRKSILRKEVVIAGKIWKVVDKHTWEVDNTEGITWFLENNKDKRTYVTQKII